MTRRGSCLAGGSRRILRETWTFPLLSAGLLFLAALPLAAQGVPAAAVVPANPLDQPIAWMQEARRNYGSVRDYTCTLIKKENLSTNPSDNIILMKCRTQPFSVYMRWLSPRKFAGQEVCYVHGQNGNKLRVHAKGLIKGIAGFVSVDLTDPRVTRYTRHTIYEAGIGALIEHTLRAWEADRKFGNTRVDVAEYEYDKKRCYRVETTHTQRRPEFPTYRGVVFLDKETKFPIRHELYDWPRPGGTPTGDLIELASYVDIRFNVGLNEREFAK